ncbi:MAG TPA: RNA polymerase sigma factor [Candidatus Gemmiger excrementavium]|uniref:RNA polymerase sigma factor n=1 Tax=Candidatus Gemmiger excrementavium TaxID=2838608 RepID=A0A9D2F4I0_9FIRM|nr:RNA polymerase sigma factor [Candidatus Gemmiger excrementavium]
MQTEQELETLVRAYTPALLRYCTGLLGCEADAQDAVQATFIKAWERRHTLRGGGQDNERAWLYRIAYRTALDMLRAARRAEQRKPPEPLPPDPGITESLRDALNTLDPLDRALVLERVLDGLDYAALARIHQRPAAYLRTRYHRAKRRLAELLQKEGLHHDP